MSGEIEAMGALATAALAATVLDRPAAEGVDQITAGHAACANCDTPLHGNFCTDCGQRAHIHRSLAHVGEEFLHGITHFDGKAWQTLPMLLFRPGKLTRDYIIGRRARYIAPVPLFLLVVFLMFFVFSFVKVNPGGGATTEGGKQMTRSEAKAALPGIEAELAGLDRQIAAARASASDDLYGLQGARIGVAAARQQVKARADGKITNPADLPGALARELGGDGGSSDVSIDLGNQSLDAKARKALNNPELFFYKIQGKAYKLSFLLVPLSLPWLWLIFAWKRGIRVYDHAVFALYSISFMSLLFVVGSLAIALEFAFGPFWFMLLFVVPVAHMFVQLKGSYALSNGSAAWRTVALGAASVITLGIYAVLMVALGVLD
jgi:hypothetical protein